MARFVHITDARDAAKVRRNGLRLSAGFVFCVPMTSDPSQAFQWSRELKRRGYRLPVAVIFSIPDAEPVRVGRFGKEGEAMTAAQAVSHFASVESPLGLEVRISRSIARGEVKALRAVPRVAGWRYYPEAKHNRPFWPSRGERNAGKLRRSINARYDAEDALSDVDEGEFVLSLRTMRLLGDWIGLNLVSRLGPADDQAILASLRNQHPDIDLGYAEARAQAERELNAEGDGAVTAQARLTP